MTFRDLIEVLRRHHAAVRERPHAVTFMVDGERVEVFRVRVGGDEWAALTSAGGPGVCPRNPGLGAVVTFSGGWALRLSLPVGEVQPRTFAGVVRRLAAESAALRHAARRPRDPSVFEAWADAG